MSLDRIRLARKRTIGTNQTAKALQANTAREVFIARDADTHVVRPVIVMAKDKGVPLQWVESMKLLGKACGIEVGAATAAILDE